MYKPSRRKLSPAVSPLSPTSPRWLDETEQECFLAEPDQISEFSEKIEMIPQLIAQPRRRDGKWLRNLREVISELRSVFKAKQIGIPIEAFSRCLRSDETSDSDAADAASEITLLGQQPVQPRLLWSEDGWHREATGLIRKLLEILGQKQVSLAVNSFLDFIGMFNNKKANYEKVLSGHLDKIRNRLLCRNSAYTIPYDVFLGNSPLQSSEPLPR